MKVFDISILLLLVLPSTLAHVVPGLDSLNIQSLISKRAANLIDPVYGNLDAEDIDFIDTNLKVFTEDTASKCGQCKNRIRYARSLIEQYPEEVTFGDFVTFQTLFSYQ